MPNIEFRSNAKPSQFAYPPPLEDKKEKAKEKVETAVLSITAKQKKKEAEKKEKEDKMEVVGFISKWINVCVPFPFFFLLFWFLIKWFTDLTMSTGSPSQDQ